MRKTLSLMTGAMIAISSGAVAQPVGATVSPSAGLEGDLRPSLPDAPVGPADQSPAATPASASPDATNHALPLSRQIGIFAVTPGLTTGSYYDDNVFATATSRRADGVFFARPEISAAAGDATYGFQSSAYVEGRKHATYSSEDQVNGGATAAAVFQYAPDVQLRGQVDYQHAHEDRGSGESAFVILDRPVAYDQISGGGAVNKRFDQAWVSVGAAASGVFYQNDTLLGFPVNETYRNAAIPTATVRVGHVVAPLTSVFVDVTGNTRQFQYQPLSSTGYRAAGGLLFEPGPGARVKGEAFAGYMHQDYRGAGLDTVDSWTYGVAMNFLLTNVLTLAVEGRREAKETPLFDGSLVQDQLGPTGGLSLIESSIGGRFDYQVLPRLVVGAGATFINDAYQGTSQEDRYVSPLASINYALTPHVALAVDYRRLEYRPDIIGIDGFQKNVVMGSVHATF